MTSNGNGFGTEIKVLQSKLLAKPLGGLKLKTQTRKCRARQKVFSLFSRYWLHNSAALIGNDATKVSLRTQTDGRAFDFC